MRIQCEPDESNYQSELDPEDYTSLDTNPDDLEPDSKIQDDLEPDSKIPDDLKPDSKIPNEDLLTDLEFLPEDPHLTALYNGRNEHVVPSYPKTMNGTHNMS
jgi:hypothetical protein